MGIPSSLGMYPVYVDITSPNYNPQDAILGGVKMLKKTADELGVPTLSKSGWDDLVDRVGLPQDMKSKTGFKGRLSEQALRILKAYGTVKAAGDTIKSVTARPQGAEGPTPDEPQGENTMATSNRPLPLDENHPLNQFDGLPADATTSIEQSADTSFMDTIGNTFLNTLTGQSSGVSSGQGQPQESGNAQQPGFLESLLGFGMDSVVNNWLSDQQTDRLADQQTTLMNAETRGLQNRFNQLYPNTSQWERLGAAGSSAGGSGISGAEAHRMAMELKQLEGQNAKEVAVINVMKGGITELQKAILNKDIKWYEVDKITSMFSKLFTLFPAMSAAKSLKALRQNSKGGMTVHYGDKFYGSN